MLTDDARRLLARLATVGGGVVAATETGMSDAELERAVADLGRMVDDDNRRVQLVRTTRHGERIAQVELTTLGKHLARVAHVD